MKLKRMKRYHRGLLGLVAALGVGGLLQAANINPAVSQTLTLRAYSVPEDPGTDPTHEVWGKVTSINVPLSAQALAYFAGGSVTSVRAQAVHYEGRLYIRVHWTDSTDDSSTVRAEDFADAVAIEFPASEGATVPAICMGQADAAVNIWHWRADSNAGLKDPNLVYETSLVDGYPYTDKLFYTAREANNPFANPDLGPVQSLHARAFGELSTLAVQDVGGFGVRDGDGWSVVFTREITTTTPGHAPLTSPGSIDMAFAVWDGSKDERNGRKAVSQFVTLGIGDAPAYEKESNTEGYFALGAVIFIAVSAIGVGLGAYGLSEARKR